MRRIVKIIKKSQPYSAPRLLKVFFGAYHQACGLVWLWWLIMNSYFTFVEFQRRDVIMKACEAVGSVSDSCFDIRFNPDVCSPGTEHTFTQTRSCTVYSCFYTSDWTECLCLRRSFLLWERRGGSEAETVVMGRSCFSTVQSDSSSGECVWSNNVQSYHVWSLRWYLYL